MEKLSKGFPPGLHCQLVVDATQIISDSVREVLFTLVGAILLVIAVIYVFLQDWRTTLIPAITIPVSLIGTFAFLHVFGFSINTLRTEKVWHFSVDSGLQIYLFTGTKKKALEIARAFTEIDWTGITRAEQKHTLLRKKIDEKYGWG